MIRALVFLCVVSSLSSSKAWDLGCYKEARNNREFNISGGSYKISDSSPQQCTSSCAHGKYTYAATEGSYCYCGNTKDRVVKVDQSKCVTVCTGNLCSGDVYIRVFQTTGSIEGLNVNSPSVGFLLQNVPFSASAVKGKTNASYTFDFGDKSYVLSTCCNITHKYTKTGVFKVNVFARNNFSGPIQKSTWVSIESTLGLVRLQCPTEILESGNKTTVTVYTSQGSRLQGKWITKLNETNYFNMSDTIMTNVGSKASFGNISGSPQSDGAYIKPTAQFKRGGRVMAWELYASKIGTVRLQVYRPVCSPNEVFCPSALKCISSVSTCPSVMKFKCDGEVCLHTGKCLQGCKTNRTAYSSSSLPLVDYKLISDVIVNITKFGYNLFTLRPSQSNKVQAGDVIGWSTNSSAGDLAHEKSADPEYFYPSSDFNIIVGSTLQKKAPATRYNINHVIKAHMSQESFASNEFTFPKAGLYNISFLVKNAPVMKKEDNLDFCMVSVQDRITGLQIKIPACYDQNISYAVGEQIDFEADVEKGSNITYTWSINKKMFDGQNVGEKIDIVGLHNVILTATNNISANSISTVFSVLNEVGDIFFNHSSFIEVEQPANFSVAVSKGTNVTIEVSFDGTLVTRYSKDEANNTVYEFSHVFKYGGWKAVTIIASNSIKSPKGTKTYTEKMYVKGKIGDIITDVQPQRTCNGTLEIATGQSFDISIYSTIDNLAINYTMYDGLTEYKTKSTLSGKVTFRGLYKEDFSGNIVINASANGELVKTVIPVIVSKCGPYAILKPVAYKRKNPMSITKANTLELKYSHVVEEKPGCIYGHLDYKWRIFSLQGDAPVEVQDFRPVYGFDKPIFKVAPLTLKEGNYTINMSLTYSPTQQCYSYETYIEVHMSSLFCVIRGGYQRGVAYQKGAKIVLDGGRAVDPDQPNDSKLSYKWECRRQQDNTTNIVFAKPRIQNEVPFCNSTSFVDIPINPSDVKVELPIEHFLEGATYDFQLFIKQTQDGREKRCAQKIIILPEKLPSISIECKSNCRDKVNPYDRLILSATCSNCGNSTEDLQYEWSVLDANMKIDSIKWNSTSTSTGFDKESFVILESVFKERSEYDVKLKVTRRTQSVFVWYNFMTTSMPYGGSCRVIPDTGFTLQDNFKVSCNKWVTDDPQITYEFLYKRPYKSDAQITSLPEEESATTLWYFGPFRETPANNLPVGDEKEEYRLPLIVKVINRFGAFSVFNLNVTVKPLALKAASSSINDISLQLQKGKSSNLDPKKNPQEVIALVTAASALLNDNKASKDVSKEKSKEVRDLMIEKLTQVEVTSLPMITEQCHALKAAINNKNEVTSNSQIKASGSLMKSSKVLLGKAKEKGYEKKSPREVEEVAKAVFSAASKTFEASESTTEDFLAQVLENLKKKADAPKSRNWNVRIREHAGEDSAEAAENVVGDLYSAINYVTTAIQENKVQGENETSVTTNTFGLQLKKSTLNKIKNESLSVYGSNRKHIGSFVLPQHDFLRGVYDPNKPLSVQIVQFGESPIRWDKKVSAFMNASVLGLEVLDENDQEIPVKDTKEPIEVWLPVSSDSVEHLSQEFDSTTFLEYHYQVVNSEAVHEPLLIRIKPINKLTMFVRFSAYPTTTKYDLMLQLPNANKSLPWPFTYVDTFTLLINDLREQGGHVYLGLKASELMEKQVLEKPGNVGSFEVRQRLQINYTMDVRSVGCRFWSQKQAESWSSDGCKVGNQTTYKSVQCLCNHLTFFGSLSIKPNPIGKLSLENFKQGYTCLIAVCVIFLLYFIALIWARRKDRADSIKVGACPLPDNDPTDHFRYEVTLWTSMRRGAGTTSKVNIILCGEEHDSETRTLQDPERKPFQRGSVDTFLLTTPYILGTLPYIRIWQDNSGGSWFLSRVMVVDLQTDDHHYFICNRWLAVDEDDGQVERLIPLASKEELTEFQHLFVARTRRNLSDSHLWFSVFARPASSRFTRVQRLTCCLCLMMMSMMTSCMYYGIAEKDKLQQNFGGFSFTWSQVFIGIICSLIVFPVNLIVVSMFRSVRPKPHRITHRKIPMPPKLSLTVKNLNNYNRMKDSSDESKGSNNSLDSTQEKNNAKMRLSINDVHTDVDRISFTSSPLLVDNRRQSNVWDNPGSSRLGSIVQWFKRHSSLPYYFVYLAWFSSFVLTVGAAVVIVLYGIGFGNAMSLKWLFTSMISFVQDVIITQPLKVLGSAIFFALIVKKPDKGEFEVTSDTAQLAEDEEWAHQANGYTTKTKKSKSKLLPPNEAKLLAMRNMRMKERKMYSVIREVGSFYIFLCLVMMIAYTHKDFNSFVQTDSLKKMFVGNFVEIKKDHDFWIWARDHLMPNLFPSEWYNGQKIKPNGFFSDRNSQMVGGARLRHIRIKDEVCVVPPSTTFINRKCFGQYTMDDEEKQDYLVSWANVTKYSKPVSRKDVSWRYQSWTQLDGYPVWAQLNTYSGGGYVLVLEPGMKNMENLKKLEKQFWIDRHTRAVITEFTAYNAQTNLFTIATLVAEFPATGGVISYVNIHTARLYNYTQNYEFFVVACECLFVLFILFFLYRELRKLFREGTPHFKQFWNICEIIIVSSAAIGIGLFFYRLMNFTNVLEKTRNAPFQFKSFQLAAYWDEMYTLTIAILVTFATIKLNKLLRFNKRMSLLSSTLKNAAFPLLMFGLIFGILFLAFTLIGTVVFGSAVNDYRNSASSFTSLLSLMLGKTSFLELYEANRVLAPLFFFGFMFLVSMVLINMFLSIIIDSYHEVKRDLEKQNNEYEIVDFIIERFKLWSGIGKTPIKPQFKQHHVRWDAARAKVKTVYAFKGGDYLSDLEDRLEKLIDRTNQLYTEVFPAKFRRPARAKKQDHRL